MNENVLKVWQCMQFSAHLVIIKYRQYPVSDSSLREVHFSYNNLSIFILKCVIDKCNGLNKEDNHALTQLY